jgi:hydrogenase maturation protease
MTLASVEKIAEAVLYEGYMLYPYRASAVKNQQRWNFGVLSPRQHCERQDGADAWMMQTECLLQGDASTRLSVEIRFLQIVNRSVCECVPTLVELPAEGDPRMQMVESLTVGGQEYIPWQEAIERKITIPALQPATFSSQPLQRSTHFEFEAKRELEPLCDRDGRIAGVIVRDREELTGSVEVNATCCRDGVFKVAVWLRNLASEEDHSYSRDEALTRSLVSAHTILTADNGQFVSMLDPPDDLKELAAGCNNQGTWPVLAGEDGARDAMLSSPIILYDYPQIAPESPGSLFDGTEIDEILSLRILALTDDEKREMRQSDDRTRQILERTEQMPHEQFMKLHGVMRGLRPFNEEAL